MGTKHRVNWTVKISVAIEQHHGTEGRLKVDLHMSKCDVISENLPYGGTNSVLLDQLFSHVCDNIKWLKLHREQQKCLL